MKTRIVKSRTQSLTILLAVLVAFGVSACGGSTSAGNQPQPAAGNTPPTISGSPATTVTANTSYTFAPSATDSDGNALTFSISNRPTWAAFNSSTGVLSGTPTAANVGTTSGIVIGVSDGGASASLSAFSITVTAVAGGSATLTWEAPTTNQDGTAPLTDLAGYVVRYGTSPGSYTSNVRLYDRTLTTYGVTNVPSGTYYFVVQAFDTSNNLSPNSEEVSKIIP